MSIFIPSNDGRWVDEKFSVLQDILNDFNTSKNSDLELRWIPPENRSNQTEKANPYCIWDNRSQTVVFFASELDSPQQILGKLLDIDNTKGDVLKRLEAHNDALKLFAMKEQMEKMEEANDMAEFLIRSPLNFTKFRNYKGDLIKVDDQRRRIG